MDAIDTAVQRNAVDTVCVDTADTAGMGWAMAAAVEPDRAIRAVKRPVEAVSPKALDQWMDRSRNTAQSQRWRGRASLAIGRADPRDRESASVDNAFVNERLNRHRAVAVGWIVVGMQMAWEAGVLVGCHRLG